MESVTVNGTGYSLPSTGEDDWGADVTPWMVAVSQHLLQKTGGSFTLSAEVDFGATYGLKSAYFKSKTSNISTAGILRLANNEGIGWRDAANSADKILKLNASDQLELDGSTFITTTGTINNSRAVATDGSGYFVTSSVTATELGYLSGVTSALQTQLDAKALDADLDTHTADTAAHGATGAVVGTTNSQTLTNKILTAPTLNGQSITVVSKNAGDSPYTALVTDDVILCDASSGAITVNLYAASGNNGKTLLIKKIKSDTSVNAITIDGNSSETIDGSTTIKLNTAGESAKIICDGSNWHVLERHIPWFWASYTPTFGSGFGTTGSADFEYWREGAFLCVSGRWQNGTITTSAPSVSIPSGLAIDLTAYSNNRMVGILKAQNIANADFDILVLVDYGNSNTTSFTFGEQSSNNALTPTSNATSYFSSFQYCSMFAKVPISGWNT